MRARARLLQRLQHGVGGAHAELLGAADDEDARAPLVRRVRRVGEDDGADLVDRDLRQLGPRAAERLGRVEALLDDGDVGVERRLRALRREGHRAPAGVAAAAAERVAARADERLREREGAELLAGAVGALEAVGVVDAAAPERGRERGDGRVLTEDVRERHAAGVARTAAGGSVSSAR